MTMIITSTTERTKIQSHNAICFLKGLTQQKLASLFSQFKSEDHTQQAIQILRDASAALDMREWAERYLCKMTTADASRYCAERRAQS
jgi:hypothetical protein